MSLKVLIADSDWRFAQQASNYLEDRAHLVVHEPRAKEALAQAQKWHPDLVIISDELAEKGLLGSLTAMNPRPAVLLNGWMDRYDRLWRAWQLGGDELLVKPVFHSHDLQLAIMAAMKNAAAGTRSIRPAAASA